MTARTPAPAEQVAEQLAEMVNARAWFWLNRSKPLTTPDRYAEAAVARIRETLEEVE